MVIVNYEQFLHDKIQEQVQQCPELGLRHALTSKQFQMLVVRLYEYCEELNIIKRRIQKLKFFSQKKQTMSLFSQLVMPKLIDSEIRRIDTKAKEISTAYSLFLFKQRRFKVFSNESKYYEALLAVIVRLAVHRCFSKEDGEHLAKEVNRLFRTNTFNTNCCKKGFAETTRQSRKGGDGQSSVNFRVFRRTVYSQTSQIKPYINNKTCFKSLKSRSPVISLWHPNSQFLSFSLARKENAKKPVQL